MRSTVHCSASDLPEMPPANPHGYLCSQAKRPRRGVWRMASMTRTTGSQRSRPSQHAEATACALTSVSSSLPSVLPTHLCLASPLKLTLRSVCRFGVHVWWRCVCMTWAELRAGGDDDAFYSPKSSASFSSDASFVSTTEQLGRSPFEGEGFGDDLTRASSGLVSASSLPGQTTHDKAVLALCYPSPARSL